MRGAYTVAEHEVKAGRVLGMRKGTDDRFLAPQVDIKAVLDRTVEEHKALVEKPPVNLGALAELAKQAGPLPTGMLAQATVLGVDPGKDEGTKRTRSGGKKRKK